MRMEKAQKLNDVYPDMKDLYREEWRNGVQILIKKDVLKPLSQEDVFNVSAESVFKNCPPVKKIPYLKRGFIKKIFNFIFAVYRPITLPEFMTKYKHDNWVVDNWYLVEGRNVESGESTCSYTVRYDEICNKINNILENVYNNFYRI